VGSCWWDGGLGRAERGKVEGSWKVEGSGPRKGLTLPHKSKPPPPPPPPPSPTTTPTTTERNPPNRTPHLVMRYSTGLTSIDSASTKCWLYRPTRSLGERRDSPWVGSRSPGGGVAFFWGGGEVGFGWGPFCFQNKGCIVLGGLEVVLLVGWLVGWFFAFWLRGLFCWARKQPPAIQAKPDQTRPQPNPRPPYH
jgi:hypothetical protein